MAEHLTRRELKTDQFALTIEHAADYFGLHRRHVLQIAGGVVIAAIVGTGVYFWMDHASAVRAQKLSEAMQIADAPVNPTPQVNTPGSYPSQPAKEVAEAQALTAIATKYSGSREGSVAEYTLAGMAATAGRDDEARRRFQAAIDSGDKDYASLARLALAQLDFTDNKAADGEKLLRDLMIHPTAVVSKEQATITLARLLARTRPAEARALLDPLMKEAGEVGRTATAAQADISAK